MVKSWSAHGKDMARARWIHGENTVRTWYAAECFPRGVPMARLLAPARRLDVSI